MQTCWNQLAHFSETARIIRLKYDQAVLVGTEIRENSSQLRITAAASEDKKGRRRLEEDNRVGTTHKRPMKKPSTEQSPATSSGGKIHHYQLQFQQSSDLCDANALGPGTVNRSCQRGDNCEVLCCGRGYNVHKMTVVTPCKCKLVLCCTVQCQNCLVERIVNTCK